MKKLWHFNVMLFSPQYKQLNNVSEKQNLILALLSSLKK